MLETKAVFRRKDTEIEATDCVVDKVVRLSGAEFDRFSHNLMRDWSFIRDNPIDRVVDAQGRYHCLLVVGEGRRDGILVNPEGADYARYSAFIPNAQAWLDADRHPSLSELAQKLTDAVDYIVSEINPELIEAEYLSSYAVSNGSLSEKYGITFGSHSSLTDVFIDMLQDRPEVASVRFDVSEFLIDPAPREAVVDLEHDNAISAVDDTETVFAVWKTMTEQNTEQWREDKRYRQKRDGALFYIGGEQGQYMRITNDGTLAVGTYELARPGIEDAVLLSRAVRQYGSYEQAFLSASNLAGQRFMVDIFNEKPSVIEQIRQARKAPPVPHKPRDNRGDFGPEL